MEPLHNTNNEMNSAGSTLDAAAKTAHQRSFQRGIMWLGIGVILMGLSFCINFCMYQSSSDFNTIMYIMTSVGSVAILKGMVDIFGF